MSDELIKEICATLSREDWILWAGYLIEHKADELEPSDLAALTERRNHLLTVGGLLDVHNEVIH